MNNDIFEEIEHWLKFIHIWESEHKEAVPDTVLDALELALEKALLLYRNKKFPGDKPRDNAIH
jgi:hypothetical protein